MRRVVLWVALSFALVVSASLGAGVASADGCGGYEWSCEQERAERFIKNRAKVVSEAQPSVFPNARINAREVYTGCSPLDAHRRFPRNWGWKCNGYIGLYEISAIAPPEDFDPEWPIRQRARRSCRWGLDGAKALVVRPKRGSRELRLIGGWSMDCALEEQAIQLWNKYGPDYQPNVTEPTPYERVEQPPHVPKADDEVALLAPPGGEPGGFPLGPLSTPPPSGTPRADNVARSSAHSPGDTLLECSGWFRYPVDPRYFIYVCTFRPHSLPGASPGIFNNVTNYEAYYWAGDRNSNGQAVGRLFYTGVVPQINYVHG